MTKQTKDPVDTILIHFVGNQKFIPINQTEYDEFEEKYHSILNDISNYAQQKMRELDPSIEANWYVADAFCFNIGQDVHEFYKKNK